MDLERFPLDYESLKRGDFLAPEVVERAVLTSRTEDGYWAKVLKLRDGIRRWFLDNRGDFVTIVCEGDGLRILTHPEQSEYASRRGSRAVGQIMHAVGELQAVDVAQLPNEMHESHARRQRLASFRAQQLLKPPPPLLE